MGRVPPGPLSSPVSHLNGRSVTIEDNIGGLLLASFDPQAKQEMISFIIPAYNEELELSWTLAAISAATSGVARPCEIIVVNDASTDATARIASQAGAEVVSIDRRQIAAARNAGAQAAQGEYLFVVDADTTNNTN